MLSSKSPLTGTGTDYFHVLRKEISSSRKVSVTDRKDVIRIDHFEKLKPKIEYKTIHSRLCENHVSTAIQVLKKAEKLTKRRKSVDSGSQSLSESVALFSRPRFSKPDKEEEGEETKMGSTVLMKRLGLAKEDLFTGTEAGALNKLLRSMGVKKWSPELYFHIRFFSVRNKLHPMSEEAKALARRRWHYIMRVLKTMAKIEKVLAARSYEKTLDCVTYIDMTNADIEPLHFGKYHSLTFDKTAYKVHANTMLSGDAQDILRSKLPAERSPEDIEQVVLSLQYVNDFAKLPVTLQHKLVETAYYIWVSSNRVILRQGHVPRNYYFVLLGQAMSKRFRADGKTETTAIIRKGDGFGSLAIFNQCPRLVTVISQTPLHLLVIPKGEIITHFIKGYAQTSQDNLDFLSKLWFMQSWPQELLVKCPSQYRWRWFRRTEIVEFDSDKSEWIYVITAGTLKVFQRFPVRRRSLSTVRFSVDSSVSTSRTGSQICSKHCPLTDQEAGSQQSEANAGRNASGTSTIMRVIFTEKAAESGMTKHKVKGQKSLPSDSVPVIAESSESYKLTGCSPSPPERRKSCPSPSPPERRKSCPSPSPSERRKSCLSPSPSERRKSCLSPSPSERRKSCPSPSPSERRKSCPSPSPSERRKSCPSPSPSERRKSCLSPSPSERRKSCLSLSPPERRKSWLQNCNYKLVDTLHSLEVFGLEDLCLDPTHPPPKRRLLLISEGVECLLLSKNFYLQMASPRLRQNVRSHLSKLAHTQVTSADCSLIPLGGVQKDPNTILDPMDPQFCVHCQ